MEGFYNLRSPAVKRLMREAAELKLATEEYYAQPLENNLFEWHFTVRGPLNTDFHGGVYHGRITLPPDYPMKPPSIILLTPNGRFEVNKKICLSISGHHPESWQPSWSIRTALLAIIGFMPTHGNGAIGSLDYTPEERKSLAQKSKNWECSDCGKISLLLHNPEFADEDEKINRSKMNDFSTMTSTNGRLSEETQMLDACGAPEIREHQSAEYEEGFHSAGSVTTATETMPRQRVLDHTIASPHILSEITNSGNIELRIYAKLTTACMWVIVFLIIVLLTRRIFFL